MYTYQNSVPNILLNIFNLLPLFPANTKICQTLVLETWRQFVVDRVIKCD